MTDFTEDAPLRFYLHRDEDVSGVSGTGNVAWGVLWPDGYVSLRWKPRDGKSSTSVWDDMGSMIRVHGHDGATVPVFVDSESDPVRIVVPGGPRDDGKDPDAWVAARAKNSSGYCLYCRGCTRGLLGEGDRGLNDVEYVVAEELPFGGICSECGRDVLA